MNIFQWQRTMFTCAANALCMCDCVHFYGSFLLHFHIYRCSSITSIVQCCVMCNVRYINLYLENRWHQKLLPIFKMLHRNSAILMDCETVLFSELCLNKFCHLSFEMETLKLICVCRRYSFSNANNGIAFKSNAYKINCAQYYNNKNVKWEPVVRLKFLYIYLYKCRSILIFLALLCFLLLFARNWI